jgi:hypothetical protein
MDIAAWKQVLSVSAIALTFIAYAPYVWFILKGRTRPHVFSWVIWGVTTLLAGVAQLADGGGSGAWPICVSGVIAVGVAVLSWMKRGDATITRSDWAFLVAAMASIPAWLLTDNPLWASVILTVVDILGFGPSFRKAWSRPHEEGAGLFILLTLRNGLAVMALQSYSLTTLIFPLLSGLANVVFVALIVIRRPAIPRTPAAS